MNLAPIIITMFVCGSGGGGGGGDVIDQCNLTI